jgi:hypothetical protein
MAEPAVSRVRNFSEPPAYFRKALEDAERLLEYASDVGVAVPDDVRDHVLMARTASSAGWDEPTASGLLTALTKLAALLKPITAATLKASHGETRNVVRNYWVVSICLAIIIVPFSLVSFIASAISSTIRTDIATANGLAVKLLMKPGNTNTSGLTKLEDAESVTELQEYAANIRAIDRRAVQLNKFLFSARNDIAEGVRKQEEIDVKEPFTVSQVVKLTDAYQKVRDFAQNILGDVSVFYGAVTVCLLPALYAILGTCAYLLRTFERQMATQTFTHYHGANSARFLVAAIGGAVVGLFNNFTIGQGASIPPLAIAFLVGYAVEVFFAFLDTMLKTFSKGEAGSVQGMS